MNETTITRDGERRARIAVLLRRSPALEAGETEEVIDFLSKGAILELGLLTGDPELQPIIDRVRADHGSRLGLSLGKAAGIVLAILVPFVALCWAMWG